MHPERSEFIVRDGRIYHLGLAPDEIHHNIVLVGDPARAHRVAAHFDTIEHRVEHREYVTLTGRRGALPLTVVGTGIGTDNVEIALLELHALANVDLATGLSRDTQHPLHFIRVGTSGAVQANLAPGTLAIAEYALGLDSTGTYYDVEPADERVLAIERRCEAVLASAVAAEARFRGRLPVYASRASSPVHRALVSAAAAAGELHASGITVSSPGFYGPSSRRVAGLRYTVADIKASLAEVEIDSRRILNMEMESSLLFLLAQALGHRAGTLCVTLSAPQAADQIIDPDDRIEAAIQVALDAFERLQATPGSS